MAGLLSLDELFEGRHFDREIIVLCVKWYLRFKLSFRDLVEMMAERNLSMAHTTIMRWEHHYASLCVRVRAPLEPVRPIGWAVVARR
jgi:transposase-like protein